MSTKHFQMNHVFKGQEQGYFTQITAHSSSLTQTLKRTPFVQQQYIRSVVPIASLHTIKTQMLIKISLVVFKIIYYFAKVAAGAALSRMRIGGRDEGKL